MDKEVKELLDDHGGRIAKLELTTAKMEERFSKIDYQLSDMKQDLNSGLTMLENNITKIENIMLNNFNSLLDYKKNESNNKTQLLMKVLGIAGSVIVLVIIAYYAGKGINLPIPQ